MAKTRLFLVLVLLIVNANAQTKNSCTTPNGSTGRCVPLKECFNLYSITQLTRTVPPAVETAIKNAKCSVEDIADGVCCPVDQIFELPDDCGLTVHNRIAHGNETVLFEFPWMALLMYRNTLTDELEGNCGGSLVNERYVLTAAHCLSEPPKARVRMELEYIRLGEHTISTALDCMNFTDPDSGAIEQDCAEPAENVPYESFAIHSQYKNAYAGNDIALIRLARKVTFKDHIKPICLPIAAELKDVLLPQYYVAGWGLTHELSKSDVLLKAKLPRVEQAQCQGRFDPFKKRYNITITPRQICAGAVDLMDTCAGDSGGPLMWLENYLGRARYVQFGVVSYGVKDCGLFNFPGVYVRVGTYLGWILANMKA